MHVHEEMSRDLVIIPIRDGCGIPKKTSKELRDHQRSHKTSVCPQCEKVISLSILYELYVILLEQTRT